MLALLSSSFFFFLSMHWLRFVFQGAVTTVGNGDRLAKLQDVDQVVCQSLHHNSPMFTHSIYPLLLPPNVMYMLSVEIRKLLVSRFDASSSAKVSTLKLYRSCMVFELLV